METYVSVLLYLALAELLRRFCQILIFAFTGPLAKIPGPWYAKFTAIPWTIDNVTGDSMNKLPDLVKRYGDVIRIGPNDILVANRDGAQKILVEEDLIKAPIYDSVRLHDNVTSLITERDKALYKQKRRMLSPGFSISYLNALEPLMQECIHKFEEYLDKKCAEGNGFAVINMSRMLGNLTFDVMSATSFGGSFGLVESDDSKLKNIFIDRLKRSAIDAQFPFIKYLPFVPPSQGEDMNNMVDGIIAKRKAEKGPAKKDLVQIFIDSNESNPEAFSNLHVREEMSLFMIAGSDTTSTTATFTLLLLMNNQDKYRKLVDEIVSAFPAKDEPITFAKTQDLDYLNAVINESMRVMPIVTVGLARYTTEPILISKYEIPPETIVSPAISIIMKDPRLWPDPEDFIPERWLGQYKGVDADRRAFLPFSAGSRNCIGQQFALKELRLILATLIRRYDLDLIPGQSHKMKVHTVPWFTQGFYNVGVKPKA